MAALLRPRRWHLFLKASSRRVRISLSASCRWFRYAISLGLVHAVISGGVVATVRLWLVVFTAKFSSFHRYVGMLFHQCLSGLRADCLSSWSGFILQANIISSTFSSPTENPPTPISFVLPAVGCIINFICVKGITLQNYLILCGTAQFFEKDFGS